jgi:hypothetical protein
MTALLVGSVVLVVALWCVVAMAVTTSEDIFHPSGMFRIAARLTTAAVFIFLFMAFAYTFGLAILGTGR